MVSSQSAALQNLRRVALRSLGRIRDDVKRRATDHASERYRQLGFIDETVRLPHGTFIEGGTTIGAYTTFSGPARIRGLGELRIGRYCAFGDGFNAVTSNHDLRFASTHFRPARIAGLEIPAEKGQMSSIGNAVWVGDRVTVLPGVSIGDGAVIGAGSVVAKDIDAFDIAVGVPCRGVRPRFSPAMVEALLELAWWNWPDDRIIASRELFELDLTQTDPAVVKSFR